MRKLFFLICTGVFLVAISDAHSAVTSGDMQEIQRQQDQIIQQQEERLRRQQEELLQRRGAPPAMTEPKTLPTVPENEAACMEVRRVEVSGATLISESDISDITAAYEGRCLTLADMNNLLRDISNLYIAAGYITSRAFLSPEQSDDGVLRIVVIEGHIEKIIINDGEHDYYYRGVMAFAGLEGGPLRLWDIEQGLDQLNRLPSANATLELEPGESVGGTIVKVTYPHARTWRVGVGVDNAGQRSTGETQYSASFVKDNFMGIGDQWSVYWTEDMSLAGNEPFRSREKIGHNNSFSAYVSIPYGYWTFSFNASRSKYDTTIFGANQKYDSDGDTTTFGYQVERVIHRSGVSKTTLSLGLNLRDNNSYIEGFLLDASSYNLTTIKSSLSHSRKLLGGAASASFSYTRGIACMGAERREESPMDPHSVFDKYSLYLSWYRPFELSEQRFAWLSTFFGQWSPQTLYSAERIQIGSQYSVRGFQESSMSGDKGAYLRNELSWNAPWPEALSSEVLRGIQLYGAYDYGFIHKDRRDPFESGEMHGVGVGLRSLGALSVDLCVSKALKSPNYIRKKESEVYLTLSYEF